LNEAGLKYRLPGINDTGNKRAHKRLVWIMRVGYSVFYGVPAMLFYCVVGFNIPKYSGTPDHKERRFIMHKDQDDGYDPDSLFEEYQNLEDQFADWCEENGYEPLI
jgi:hypothetical protein